jgi:hypothetical protein
VNGRETITYFHGSYPLNKEAHHDEENLTGLHET